MTKKSAVIANHFSSGSYYIRDKSGAISFVPEREGDSANDPISWKGIDTGGDRNACRILGLFQAMLIVGCICVGQLFNKNRAVISIVVYFIYLTSMQLISFAFADAGSVSVKYP